MYGNFIVLIGPDKVAANCRLHPDKSKDDPDTAQRKFMEMQEAFEILSDPQTKGMIDDVVRSESTKITKC